MTEKFTNRKGKCRIYDGTATPFYLELAFDAGDWAFPSGRPLPEEIPVLDKGRKDANSHYILGPEDSYIQALDGSFNILLTDLAKSGYALDWIDCLNGAASTVNSNTIESTKGDTQNDGANNNPAFADSNKLACNIEVLFDSTSGTDSGWQLNEVYIPYPDLSSGEDAVTMAAKLMIYGTINRIAAFTSGTDVTA